MKRLLFLLMTLIPLGAFSQNLSHTYYFKDYQISYPDNCGIYFNETSDDGKTFSFILRYFPSELENGQMLKVTMTDDSVIQGVVSLLGLDELNSKELSEMLTEIYIESYIAGLSSSPRYSNIKRGSYRITDDGFSFVYTANFISDRKGYEETDNKMSYSRIQGQVGSWTSGKYTFTVEMQVPATSDFSVLHKIVSSIDTKYNAQLKAVKEVLSNLSNE